MTTSTTELRAEIVGFTKSRPIRWRWLRSTSATYQGVRITQEGDVSCEEAVLHHPEHRRVPGDEVDSAALLQAAAGALRRDAAARRRIAEKAAVTRKRRRELKISSTAEAIRVGKVLGPRSSCVICGRGLADQHSIDRGIGSECWEGVLQIIEDKRITKLKEAA